VSAGARVRSAQVRAQAADDRAQLVHPVIDSFDRWASVPCGRWLKGSTNVEFALAVIQPGTPAQ